VSTGQVLENVGYGEIVKDPNRILESDGFLTAISETGLRQALEAQGINPKKIAEKIDVLLEAKNGEKDDYTAIDKGLKHATAIYGITEQPKPTENKTYNFIFNPDVQIKIQEMEQGIKSLLTGNDKENKEPLEPESV
jgi:hypothetical protein